MFYVVNELGNKLIYFSDEFRLYGLSVDDFSPSLFLRILKIKNSGFSAEETNIN